MLELSEDQSGLLENILKETNSGEKLESVIYIELEHSDAKTRRALEKALRSNLDDVAAAVSDWLKLQIALGDDADRLPESEGTALLRWFLDRNFTLLGHEKINLKGERTSKLGVASKRTKPSLSKGSLKRAYNWFQEGGHAPLVV